MDSKRVVHYSCVYGSYFYYFKYSLLIARLENITNNSTLMGKQIIKKKCILKQQFQKSLQQSQNPIDCRNRKLLICGPRSNYPLTGSQTHDILNCLFTAQKLNRTLVVKDWNHYGQIGPEGFFQSLYTKNCAFNKLQVSHITDYSRFLITLSMYRKC